MTQFEKVTTKAKQFCAVSMFVMCAPALVLAQSSEDLNRCSEIEDDAKRVACYDEVAGRQSTVQEVNTEKEVALSAPEETVGEELVPLNDDVGAEMLSNKDKVDDDKPVRGRITSCQKNSLGDYFFFFDNGQVWKQKSDTRLRYKECDFDVTISRDFFGYKMQIEGEGKKIRIGRIR